MVATELNQHGTQGTIILQPNRSFSWRENVWFLLGISGLSLMIGLMFMLQGFWLILPFGVLELSLLGVCLYQCARFTHLQEVITFTPEALTIERGYGKPDKRHEFHRIFAQIFVRSPCTAGTARRSLFAARARKWRSAASSPRTSATSSRTCAHGLPLRRPAPLTKLGTPLQPSEGATATNAPPGRTLPCPASGNPNAPCPGPRQHGVRASARQRATTAS